jgi:hypothetical protein
VSGQSREKSQKLTNCEEHADGGKGGELRGANHEGKVRNSHPVKRTPTEGRELSSEGPITREKLTSCEAHSDGGKGGAL